MVDFKVRDCARYPSLNPCSNPCYRVCPPVFGGAKQEPEPIGRQKVVELRIAKSTILDSLHIMAAARTLRIGAFWSHLPELVKDVH